MTIIPGEDKLTPEQKKQYDLLTDDNARISFVKNATDQNQLASKKTKLGIAGVAGIGSQVAGALDTTPNTIDTADYAKNALSMAGQGATIGGPVGAGIGAALGIGMTALEADKQKKAQHDQSAADGLSIGQSKAEMTYKATGGEIQLNENNLYSPKHLSSALIKSQITPMANGGPVGPITTKGRAIVNAPQMATGGPVVGPGTGTSDDVKTKLNLGDFVVPAANAPIAEQLRQTYLNSGDAVKAGESGQKSVALSNGEHVFTKQEADILKSNGINLDMLAPNAEKTGYGYYKGGIVGKKKIGKVPKIGTLSDEGGVQAMADGGTVRSKWIGKLEEYYKNPNVRAYLNGIMHGEADPNNAAKGKNPDSSATGYYQFLDKTHKDIKDIYGVDGRSSDINEASLAAIALMVDNGAIDKVAKGEFDAADESLHNIWTSLPGGKEANAKTGSIPVVRQEFLDNKGQIKSIPGASSYIPYEDPAPTEKSRTFANDADRRGIPGTIGGLKAKVTNQPFRNFAEKRMIDTADEDVRPSIEGAQIPKSKMSTTPKSDSKLSNYSKDGPGSGLIAKNGKVFSKDYVDMIKTHPEYFKAQNEKELLDAVNNKKPKSIEDWNAVFARARALTGRDIDPNNPEGSFDDVLNSNKPMAQLIRMRRNEVNDGVNNGTENDKKDELNRLAQTKSEYKNSPLLASADKTTPVVKPVTTGENQDEPLPKPEEIQSPTDQAEQAWRDRGEDPRGNVTLATPVNYRLPEPASNIEINTTHGKYIPPTPEPNTKHDAEMTAFESLGSYGGLFALAQTGFGLAGVLSEKKPTGGVANPILMTEYNKALSNVDRIDPAVRANAETNFELTRRTRNAEANRMSAGDAGLSLGASRESAIDKNRAQIGLAAAEQQTADGRKAFAASRGDAVVADQNRDFSVKNERFIRNQEAAAGLLNTGITNFIGATNYSKYMHDLAGASGGMTNEGLAKMFYSGSDALKKG